MRPLAACAAVVALLTPALAACSEAASDTVPGEVVAARPSLEVIGDFGFVLIPAGRIDVVVGEPRTGEVTPDEASDDQAHEPPEGGSWIPVHVAHDPFGQMGVPVSLIGGSPQPAQVALVVDGTTISLGAPYRVVGEQGTADSGLDNVWVAVDQRPDQIESVQVAVTYDELTQTMEPKSGARDAGAAAALYVAETEEHEASCSRGGFDVSEVQVETSCVIGPAQRTPYLPGVGWAAEDHAWLVVGMAVWVMKATARGTTYEVARIDPALTVEGGGPLPPDGRLGEVRRDPRRVSATWAFDVPAAGAVEVGLRLGLVLRKQVSDAPGPAARRVTFQQTVELG